MFDFFLGVWITGFLYELFLYLFFELRNSRYSDFSEWMMKMYCRLDTAIFWTFVFAATGVVFFILWPFALIYRLNKAIV
jgi:hypothetical protein